jgi:hypothetical protein
MKMRVFQRTSIKSLIVWLMAVAVLVPSLYGFGTKFLEFIALYRGDVEGTFAISPIVNYLLASVGFLCLFGWAALGGMFRDIERPKHMMLETEARLDGATPRGGVLFERAGGERLARDGAAMRRDRFGGHHDRS